MLAEEYPPQPIPVPERIKALLGRAEAARELGISYNEFKRREEKGQYIPEYVNETGRAFYSPTYIASCPGYKMQKRTGQKGPISRKRIEIHNKKVQQWNKTANAPLPPTTTVSRAPMYLPEQAAAVFAELKKGTDLETIVGVVGVYPEHVKILYREWVELKSLGGALVLRKEVVEKINALGLPGVYPIKTDDDLLDNLKDIAGGADRPLCMSCKQGPRQFCEACASTSDD